MNRLKEQYEKVIKKQLMDEFNIKNSIKLIQNIITIFVQDS
jgi:ribosomal protein L5